MTVPGTSVSGQSYWPGLAALEASDRRSVLWLLAKDAWACELAMPLSPPIELRPRRNAARAEQESPKQ